ncbi:MAG TPA: cell envelope integrity protein TolA [Kofleriaceae bacterium]|nr:cell envelope integrity protein TolA [Kofleriaceae bacterium]
MKRLVLAVVVMAGCAGGAQSAAPPERPKDPDADFFEVVKREVFRNWDPDTVWRRIDPTSTVYGQHDRVTRLRVNLLPDGTLDKLEVAVSSGVFDLDDEALRAFRKAAPFVAPPRTLVSSDHLISFDFSLVYQVNPMLAKRGRPVRAGGAADAADARAAASVGAGAGAEAGSGSGSGSAAEP